MKFRDKDESENKYKKKAKHAGSVPGKGMKIINSEVLENYDDGNLYEEDYEDTFESDNLEK